MKKPVIAIVPKTGESEKDIHESDFEYLKKSYENSIYIADKYEILLCAAAIY